MYLSVPCPRFLISPLALDCVPSPLASHLALPVGKISLPSTILQFWDLGGQRDIRSIWSKYYDECHAVVYVVDASDRIRLEEGWAVFGMSLSFSFPRGLSKGLPSRPPPLLLLAVVG